MKMMYKHITWILLLCLAVSLGGCKKKEDIPKANELGEKLGVKEWKESFEGNSARYGTVKIHMNIPAPDIPEAESIQMIEGVYLENTPEYRERVVKKLFKEADVYDWEEADWTISYLEEEIRQLEDRLTNGPFAYNEIEKAHQKDEIKRSLEKYRDYLTTASQELVLTEDFHAKQYLVKQGNQEWVFDFAAEENMGVNTVFGIEFSNLRGKTEWFEDASFRENESIDDVLDQGNQVDNLCKYSLDEAIQMAQEFLSVLGVKSQVAFCTHIKWKSLQQGDEKEVLNGYKIYLANNKPWSLGETQSFAEAYAAINGRYEVTVTDRGIVAASIENPRLYQKRIVDVPMISFAEIQNRIREELRNPGSGFWNDYGSSHFGEIDNLEFRSMSLQYTIVNEESGSKWTLVPVWSIDDYFFNAIDGSYISTHDSP